VCSVYDVKEREKNEENKEKKRFAALSGCIYFKRKSRQILCFVCYNKGAVLALFLEVFVNNCMQALLEAKDGKYLYTY
jgi:capsid portal protein